MIVMIEASTHTIQRLWITARAFSQGDAADRERGAGMQQVLRELGASEPVALHVTEAEREQDEAEHEASCMGRRI